LRKYRGNPGNMPKSRQEIPASLGGKPDQGQPSFSSNSPNADDRGSQYCL
jgi:hypothetical protein